MSTNMCKVDVKFFIMCDPLNLFYIKNCSITKTVCKNNSLVTEEFSICGRKLSIDDIRADMLENHKIFMIDLTETDLIKTDREYLVLSRE